MLDSFLAPVVIHSTYHFPVTLAGALVAWRQGYSLTKMREEEQAEK